MVPQKHSPALLAALAAGVVTSSALVLPGAHADSTTAPAAPATSATAPAPSPTGAATGENPGEAGGDIDLLYFNDYHGRLASDPVLFAGAIEQLRAENPDGTLLLSGGDNVGASEYVSAVQEDNPTSS